MKKHVLISASLLALSGCTNLWFPYEKPVTTTPQTWREGAPAAGGVRAMVAGGPDLHAMVSAWCLGAPSRHGAVARPRAWPGPQRRHLDPRPPERPPGRPKRLRPSAARLKEWRAAATRYEKTAVRFRGVLCLAATADGLRPRQALAMPRLPIAACQQRGRGPYLLAAAWPPLGGASTTGAAFALRTEARCADGACSANPFGKDLPARTRETRP